MDPIQGDGFTTQHEILDMVKVTYNGLELILNTTSVYNSTGCGSTNDTLLHDEDLPTGWKVFIAMCLILVILATLIGNLLVIISVCYFRTLQRANNYFLVSLAFADLLVGLTAMPFKVFDIIHRNWEFGPIGCKFFNANDVLFTTASTVHLGCISIDRYTAIIHPFKYERTMNTRKLGFMLACTWIVSISLAYIPIFSDIYTTQEHTEYQNCHPEMCLFQVSREYAFISSSVTFWLPLLVMILTYQKIFREARKQENEIYAMKKRFYQDRPETNNNGIGSLIPSDGDRSRLTGTSDSKQTKKLQREHRAAKTLGIVMGVFFFCFIPFFSWYTISFGICPDTCRIPKQYEGVTYFFFWLGYLNSCLNPMIYAFFNKAFRKAFRELVKGCFTRTQVFTKKERNISLSRSDSQVNDSTQFTALRKLDSDGKPIPMSFDDFLKDCGDESD